MYDFQIKISLVILGKKKSGYLKDLDIVPMHIWLFT